MGASVKSVEEEHRGPHGPKVYFSMDSAPMPALSTKEREHKQIALEVPNATHCAPKQEDLREARQPRV
eukprot:scaffold232295_cov30-Tisochrysis_lutea.AAC.5